MPTRTTGLFDVPQINDTPITVRIELRNYRNRSSQVRVKVNRFLGTGRKSAVLSQLMAVTANGANYLDISTLQGSTIEVTTQGASYVQPTVSVLGNTRSEGSVVLLWIGPKLFATIS